MDSRHELQGTRVALDGAGEKLEGITSEVVENEEVKEKEGCRVTTIRS